MARRPGARPQQTDRVARLGEGTADHVALCRHLRSRSEGRYAYFILMSARDGREDLIAGIQAGADDFLRKPVDVDELGVRLRSGQRVLDLQAGMERRNRQLTDAYAQIQRDIEAAK